MGAAGLPETILLKPTQFVKSALSWGQRLMVDSLAGPAGEDAALLTKKPCDRAATPSPPGHRLHWVKVVLLLSAEEKVLPLKAAECAEAPISLRMFTIAG